MKLKLPKLLSTSSLGAFVVPALLSLSVGSGCAHQSSQAENAAAKAQQETVTQMRSRLEELERTNGRLNVRIEELEDQLFLLQDMTESNRIALTRRGYMQRGGYIQRQQRQARAPQPAPESYYGTGNAYGNQQPQQQPRTRRDVTRIPLSRQQGGGYGSQNQRPAPPAQQAQRAQQAAPAEEQQGEEEVVITEDEFRRFAGQPAASKRSKKSRSSTKSSGRKAQPPVTSEKLSPSKADKPSKPAPKVDNPLDLYKSGLAQYRGGNYSDALTSFEAFLNAGPKADYIDNALYWIGECHYGLGDYAQATAYFERVLRERPDGNKVPDAMLKMSLAYERLGKADESRTLLQKLTDRFPTTNAGRLGAQKLAETGN